MARYKTHFHGTRQLHKVALNPQHAPPDVADEWARPSSSAQVNLKRQEIQKWLKSHQHKGEYYTRPADKRVMFYFTQADTAFHFKLRWG